MKILMVLTSHDKLGDTGRKTGFWLEELAAPYYVFKDAGAEIVLTSPKGGEPPLDPTRRARYGTSRRPMAGRWCTGKTSLGLRTLRKKRSA
jgi:putative intracellular protease/amidase